MPVSVSLFRAHQQRHTSLDREPFIHVLRCCQLVMPIAYPVVEVVFHVDEPIKCQDWHEGHTDIAILIEDGFGLYITKVINNREDGVSIVGAFHNSSPIVDYTRYSYGTYM